MIPLRNARYDDKDILKQNGAFWNPDERYWYVPDGKDPEKLKVFMDVDTRRAYDMMSGHFRTMMPAQKENMKQDEIVINPFEGMSLEELRARSEYHKPVGFHAVPFVNLGLPTDFVVLDTETTGLFNDDEVVELSVLDSGGEELYHSFFKPEHEIDPKATAVSGLTKEMLVDEPRFLEEWPKICNAIGGRRIAGHNIGFDRRLIQQTLEKQSNGASYQRICDEMFADSIDSLRMVTELGVPKGQRKLTQLCDAIGVEESPNHRASHDCLGVLYVLQYVEAHGCLPKKERRLPDISSIVGADKQSVYQHV